jgi:hypothetical protein
MRQVWLRVNPAVRSFILGEVERQYHPIGMLEFKVRVEWMTDAWLWAIDASKCMKPDWVRVTSLPTIDDILYVAKMIEPTVNEHGFRKHEISVGGHAGTPFPYVPERISHLWEAIGYVEPVQGRSKGLTSPTADDFYLDFEGIHPFGDGNGRTGKLLHNWLLGTLNDPILIDDYFGGGNP